MGYRKVGSDDGQVCEKSKRRIFHCRELLRSNQRAMRVEMGVVEVG